MSTKHVRSPLGGHFLALVGLIDGWMLLAACIPMVMDDSSMDDPEMDDPVVDNPTVESPIQAPTPVSESALTAPQSYVDTLDHTPDPMLTDVTWTWVRRDPNGNSFGDITVPNPEDHTLVFDKDGTFSAQLDCNNAVGRYATTDVTNKQRNIFMELGPSTTAACRDSSLDRDMSNMFGPVQSYQFEDDGNTLVFIWVAAGPIDYFRQIEQ